MCPPFLSLLVSALFPLAMQHFSLLVSALLRWPCSTHCWCPPFSAGHAAFLFFCFQAAFFSFLFIFLYYFFQIRRLRCWCPPFSAGHAAFLFFFLPCDVLSSPRFRACTAGVRPFPLAMQHFFAFVSHVICALVFARLGACTAGVRPFPLATQHFYSFVSCHEICASRFTKGCARHEICASRFTKCCACHEICASRFTKCCDCQEISTSRFTKCCACHEICASRSQSAVPGTKSANGPHVQKSRVTALVTKSERLDAFRSKTLRSFAPVTKSRLWTAKARGFPTMRAAPQRERARDKHPLQPPRFCERAQSKCILTTLRGTNAL